jgi:capsular polysaccharide biosynthesis protein
MDRTSTDSSDIGPVSGRTDASRYLGMLKRWWWLISAATIIAGLSAYFVTQSIAPRYRATATLLIVQTQEPGTFAYNDVLTSERLTQTYRELVTTRPVLQAAVDAGADSDLTVEDLASKISASVVPNTQL